jgi:TPR repeat protein
MRKASAVILIAGLIVLATPVFATDGAVAYAHYVRGDYAAAYREYRALAEVGYGHYQSQVARMHARGEGVAKDSVQAYAWYALAASQGDPLGLLHSARLADELSQQQLQRGIQLAEQYGQLYVAPYRPHWQLK